VKQRPSIRAAYVCLLFGLAIPCASFAQGSAESPFRTYTVADGLTQSDVYGIAQDRTGYLWFTTARGLNRFDGNGFDHYTIADGLPNNTLTAIYADTDNSILIGDVRGGITVMQGLRVVQTIEPITDSNAPIIDIQKIGQSIFAVADGVGIFQIDRDENGFRTRLIGSGPIGVTDLVVSGSTIWVAATTGLYKLVTGVSGGLTKMSDVISHVQVDSKGTVWAVDSGARIGVWKNGVFEARATIPSNDPIVGIAISADGIVWVATSDTLFGFDGLGQSTGGGGAEVSRFTGLDGVTSVFIDRENSLWLSSSSGLIRFLGDRFQHYRLRTGTDSVTVWAITEDKRGRIWFATQTKLIMRESDESLLIVDSDYGVPAGAIRDVVTDDAGDLWFSVSDEGLFKFDTRSMIASRIGGTLDKNILDIEVASDGAIWFSTVESGVFQYSTDGEMLSRFHAPDNASIYSLDTSTDGSVWYGADEVGLVHLTPQGAGHYDQKIFGQESGLQNRLLNHINLTDVGEAWVATEEGGLYRFESGKFSNFGQETPLSDQTIYLVEPLENGTVVVGGEQGLYQLVPGVSGVAHYNQLVGFIGTETNVHATFVDSNNGLWIGTVDGASRMDITLPMPAYIEPNPTILNMETALDQLQILDNEKIEPEQLGAQVEFAAVSLLHPRGMEYSYRLAGSDDTWGSATTNKSVSYPRISPGSYEFMVRARYPGGNWSHEYASHRFTVLPHFWQQSWFILAASLAALVLLRAAMVYRTRNIEWLNKTLRAQVEDRTRSIVEAKEKLEQSNRQLCREVKIRQESDSARVEIETRFRRAFENAPIGMGLLDADGLLFDANPALLSLFWPDQSSLHVVRFADVVDGDDQVQFENNYRRLLKSDKNSLDKNYSCLNAAGDVLKTVINLSPVRSDSGEFLYSVIQIQDITESLKLTSQLEYQASYDELTGLLNRRAFETELQSAWDRGVSAGTTSYLMFMDLDQFKVVNDTSGHCAGDKLLQAVSEILLDSVRSNDKVARLGGDEFGIILSQCPTDVATRIAETIRAGIEDFRFHWDAETYRIGVSIGGLPVDQSIGDISELQQLADAACYAAKEAGRNRVHMVAGDKDSARVHRRQVRWVQRLREAMDSNRFAIYGQVIRPLAENVDEPERLEILLRLRDPESRRLIPPGAFLPAAERYGLSVELDEWVVDNLLNTLFVHEAFQAEQRSYWINLSGTSIGDKRFASFLKSAIKRSSLAPGTINFEIAETAFIRNIAEAGKLMLDLREMGCEFALDDLGGGMSSFNYLKRLPVDYVKVDGRFVRNILEDEADRIFVKSIIDIARSLKIRTVAEFVENEETLELVRHMGADYAQGFIVGRPFVLAPKLPEKATSSGEPVELRAKAG